ncbi:MAG: hypothetical protein HOY69_37845 [Streptomyces sp.]|nr:hypothetical protein [Streptomyces sp.]
MADPGPHEAIVATYGQAQQRAVAGSLATVDELWGRLDGGDLTGSWLSGVGEQIRRAVAAGQLLAASTGQPYVDAMVAADGLDSDYLPGADRVPPRAFALSAADGRPLDSLLYLPVIRTKTLLQGGMTLQQAMLRGLFDLQRMVASEVADAGRGAVGAAMVANRRVTGYIRQVRSGACARCAVLAGRWYRWNADFQRHKRCQCYGVPATAARRGRPGSPREFFDDLSEEEQDRRFTREGAEAIRAGADVAQVVNVHRPLSDTTTLSGTGKGSLFYRRELQAAERATGIRYARGSADIEAGLPRFKLTTLRLTPAEIYRLAAGREELIGLLRRYGYLI